jgi:hypothetical protein
MKYYMMVLEIKAYLRKDIKPGIPFAVGPGHQPLIRR